MPLKKFIKKALYFIRSLFSPRDLTFIDVKNKALTIETMEAKKLLSSFPKNIEKMFIKNYFNPSKRISKKILNYFFANSKITRLIKVNSGSTEALEYLYYKKKALSNIDKYFLKCKAGQQVNQRLISLDKNIPLWINKVYKGKKILIDNIGSGPGHDMIRILLQNSNLINKVHIRNIDIDKNALKTGKKIVESNKLSSNFSFTAKSFNKAKTRKADIILLIGFLCPLKFYICKKILIELIRYSKPKGLIIFSTAQKKMLYGDPLTDYIMRFSGWHMSYKSDKEALNLAIKSGWRPINQFFDEPLHYHCMTVAKLK